jgi:energy-coupling factor transport system substrate-specific component
MKWTLRDIVVTAILSVVCGAIYMGWDYFAALTGSWSPAATGVINGVWWIASGIVAYIVRKPGAALLAGIASAFFEFAFGSPYGISAVLSGLVQGGGTEIGFMVWGWRRYNVSVMFVAAALGGIGNTLQWLFQYGGDKLSIGSELGYLVLTLISGGFFAGLLPKWIGDALYRTGSLRNFEIGKQMRSEVQ